MADKRDLLVEVGTEELPPKALELLSTSFAKGLEKQLRDQGLGLDRVFHYATPRRLAVVVTELDAAQEDRTVERKGPALSAAYDAEGNPTKAAEGFARSCGVRVEELETRDSPKGAWLVYRQVHAGSSTVNLVPSAVERSLAELPIPKRMRWDSLDVEFVRPVHWLVILFGEEVVPATILGASSGRLTRGHRFHSTEPLVIQHPREYLERLRADGKVIANIEERKSVIRAQVEAKAQEQDTLAVVEEGLLAEVTALVEWPVAILGNFDRKFLEVPAEALVKTMQEHQKYFPVVDEGGSLQPCFIAVANLESKDEAQVRDGNERVIRPRFSDASFFWEQDLAKPLDQYRGALDRVVFQERLGTLRDKSKRIVALASFIADELGFPIETAMRAGELCKCDLLTQMVGEFPSLQGTMGRYYARAAGEDADVSAAIEEHYLPRHAGDRLPSTQAGQALAIADRLDTLVGIFAIGQKPTGVKDPFGLRRAALGVLRILIETPLSLDLSGLLEIAAANQETGLNAQSVVGEVFDYMMERLKAYYSDQGISADVIEAVLERRPVRPSDFDLRVKAVTHFRELPEAASLAAANKRIRNILRKAADAYPEEPDAALLVEPSEQELARQVEAFRSEVGPLFADGNYTSALTRLAALRDPVDRFFDDVMVMCDDPKLRGNRLSVLASLEGLFLGAADLSRLQ